MVMRMECQEVDKNYVHNVKPSTKTQFKKKPKIKFLNVINLKNNIDVFWAKQQSKDEEIKIVKECLLNRELLPDELQQKLKKTILFRKFDSLKIVNDVLCVEENGIDKYVVPQANEDETIKNIHEEMCHVGVDKTTDFINKSFFIENLKRKTNNIVSKCVPCQKAKTYTGRTKEALIEIITKKPFEKILIDIAYIEANSGKTKFVIGIIDHFSKLVSLTVANRQDEQTVSRIILESWIYKYGIPEMIITDKGRSFEGKLFTKLCQDLKIEKESTSPYCHQTTGLIERQFRTMRELCRAMKNDGDNRSTEFLIPKIEFTINNTKQATTGLSPFQIIYEGAQRKFDIVSNYIKKINSDRAERIFKEGERVLVRIPPATRQGKKDNIFDGPYLITKIINPRRVALCKEGENKEIERRIEWLRKFREGESDEFN